MSNEERANPWICPAGRQSTGWVLGWVELLLVPWTEVRPNGFTISCLLRVCHCTFPKCVCKTPRSHAAPQYTMQQVHQVQLSACPQAYFHQYGLVVTKALHLFLVPFVTPEGSCDCDQYEFFTAIGRTMDEWGHSTVVIHLHTMHHSLSDQRHLMEIQCRLFTVLSDTIAVPLHCKFFPPKYCMFDRNSQFRHKWWSVRHAISRLAWHNRSIICHEKVLPSLITLHL